VSVIWQLCAHALSANQQEHLRRGRVPAQRHTVEPQRQTVPATQRKLQNVKTAISNGKITPKAAAPTSQQPKALTGISVFCITTLPHRRAIANHQGRIESARGERGNGQQGHIAARGCPIDRDATAHAERRATTTSPTLAVVRCVHIRVLRPMGRLFNATSTSLPARCLKPRLVPAAGQLPAALFASTPQQCSRGALSARPRHQGDAKRDRLRHHLHLLSFSVRQVQGAVPASPICSVRCFAVECMLNEAYAHTVEVLAGKQY
jgi:hypothetical protein